MKNSNAAPSPYLIGAAIGALDTAAFLTAKKGLGVTTPFENTAALVGKKVAPDLTRVNKYLKTRDEKPKIDWEAFLVMGVAAGSFLASRGERRPEKAQYSPVWTENFGEDPGKRMSAAFVGGALMMFGARMAKGCTSGHGLTGNMQLALSSLVFTPLMFASAILTGKALYPKGEKSHE